jgi:hypothetical protein
VPVYGQKNRLCISHVLPPLAGFAAKSQTDWFLRPYFHLYFNMRYKKIRLPKFRFHNRFGSRISRKSHSILSFLNK